MRRVAIIGAGPAGLCSAKHLIYSKQKIQFEATIFEQQKEVGGTWVYRDIDKNNTDTVQGFSSIYKNLFTNLPKQSMCYPDFPFPEDIPTFPHHTQVLKYIQDFANHFSLYPLIKFNTKVISVKPLIEKNSESERFVRWNVITCDLSSMEQVSHIFDAVLVCSGHYSIPLMPDIKGIENFKGEIFHSHYYRDPREYSGKTAVVFGNGPSGTDIMSELSNVCPMVYLSHRGGGEPSRSKHKPNVVELPSISHITSTGNVVFEGGTTVEADVIIICTGYLYDYSFLSQECNVLLPYGKRVVMPTYKHLFHTKYPSLIFIGLPWKCAPMPLMHQQCAYVTRVLSREVELPSESEMNKITDTELMTNTNEGLPQRYFHRLGSRQFEYNNELAQLSGCAPNPKVMELLYLESMKHRRADLYNYKKKEYKILNEHEFLVVK